MGPVSDCAYVPTANATVGPVTASAARFSCSTTAAGVPAGAPPDVDALFRRYRLQLHYFTQGCFLPPDAVLAAIDRLAAARLPLRVVQGLADDVCPPAATRLLAARLPAGACRWVEGVGHDPFAPAMVEASMAAWAELSGEP